MLFKDLSILRKRFIDHAWICRPSNRKCCALFYSTARLRRITATDVTKGTLNESLAHPREVFRAAIVHSAYALIVVHNLWVPIHKLCYVD